MISLFAAVRRWWFANTGQLAPYETVFVESDLPLTIDPRIIYVITEDGLAWHASLLCPCGCGDIVHANLLPDERPYWEMTRHWHGLISLYPSVWRTKDCRAHFWFIKGRIRWCQAV